MTVYGFGLFGAFLIEKMMMMLFHKLAVFLRAMFL